MFAVAAPLLFFTHYELHWEVRGGECISVVSQNNDIAITQLHDEGVLLQDRQTVTLNSKDDCTSTKFTFLI